MNVSTTACNVYIIVVYMYLYAYILMLLNVFYGREKTKYLNQFSFLNLFVMQIFIIFHKV